MKSTRSPFFYLHQRNEIHKNDHTFWSMYNPCIDQLSVTGINPIQTRAPESRKEPGGGPFRPPPTISARSGRIFKMMGSVVFAGPKEHLYKILLKSDEKHGSYGSLKKNGTRDSSRIFAYRG